MVLKKHRNPKGGLNEAGRKHFESKDGGLWGDEELLDHLSDSDTIQEEFIKLREEFFIPISMKQYLLKIGGREMWDGYHPSEQGHRHWSNYMNKILKSVI